MACGGDELFYHAFKNKNTSRNYEIDFLLSRKNKICPIEVKSSGYKSHASLDAFNEKYSARILESFLIYTKDMKKNGSTRLVPIYMTMFL
jgi:predicted AAA+ superfamily ATPase